jgi:hypothetical protein
MSSLLGLTLIAVVITAGIVMLLENGGDTSFPHVLLQIIWIPLMTLWGLSWIFSLLS